MSYRDPDFTSRQPTIDPARLRLLPDPIMDDRILEQPEYPRLQGYLDVLDFGGMFADLIQKSNLPKYWRDGTELIATHDTPDLEDEGLLVPMIYWTVEDRIPVEPRPVLRHAHELAEYEEEEFANTFWIQQFINVVSFSCIDSSNYNASRLQEYLEDFLLTHYAIFRAAGITDLRYDSRVPDRILSYRERVRTQFSVRTTLYRVKTQIIRVIPEVRLQSVHVNITSEARAVINEAVVRGSGDSDALAMDNPVAILGIYDTRTAHTYGDSYEKERDYYLNDSRELQWLSGGRAPAEGATYYVSYLHGAALESSSYASPLKT
jgi:hypothetical protein